MKAVENQNKYDVRYIYIPDSTSGHCCFGYTVVDTEQPIIYSDGHHKPRDNFFRYEPVCECFDEDMAIMICNSLNNLS